MLNAPSRDTLHSTQDSASTGGVWGAAYDFACGDLEGCADLSALSGWALAGGAVVQGGQLRLTSAGAQTLAASSTGHEELLQPAMHSAYDTKRSDSVHAFGAALLGMPPGVHRLQIQIDFNVIVGRAVASGSTGGGNEGGFCLSYGSGLSLEGMGDLGGGLGLRVQFLTGWRHSVGGRHGDGGRIVIMHDGTEVGSMPYAGLRSGRVTAVSVTAESAGVSVWFDGRMIYNRQPWRSSAEWAPPAWWQLAFSAAFDATVDNHWIDDVRIVAGTPTSSVPVPLAVALNGQQYTDIEGALGYTFGSSKSLPPPPSPLSPSIPPQSRTPLLPPLALPPASLPAVHFDVVAAGTVEWFTPAVHSELRTTVADELRVDVGNVSLSEAVRQSGNQTVGVTLSFGIAVGSDEAAAAAVTTLTFKAGNAVAASAFLSTASLILAIESVVVSAVTLGDESMSGDESAGSSGDMSDESMSGFGPARNEGMASGV